MTPDEGASALTVEEIFEQPRDEHGRFQPKETPDTPAKAEPAATVEAPAVVEEPLKTEQPKDDHRVPLSEHLSEREKRQAAERRAEELERHLEALSRRPQPQREPEKKIDLFEDPDGALLSVEQRVERRMLSRFLDASFEDAHEEHGEAFLKAYAEMERSGDQGLINRIINAGNPGRTLMRWHRERETIREIGGDLPGYRKKLLTDETFRKDALSDQAFIDAVLSTPEVRKRAADLWREQAQQQTSRSNVTTLPNLSSAPAARVAADAPGGERESIDEIFARKR